MSNRRLEPLKQRKAYPENGGGEDEDKGFVGVDPVDGKLTQTQGAENTDLLGLLHDICVHGRVEGEEGDDHREDGDDIEDEVNGVLLVYDAAVLGADVVDGALGEGWDAPDKGIELRVGQIRVQLKPEILHGNILYAGVLAVGEVEEGGERNQGVLRGSWEIGEIPDRGGRHEPAWFEDVPLYEVQRVLGCVDLHREF